MARLLLTLALTFFGAASAASSSNADDVLMSYSELAGQPYNVSYDGRSMILDGKRVLLLSGSVHYTRSTPEMWPGIFQKMVDSGECALPVPRLCASDVSHT